MSRHANDAYMNCHQHDDVSVSILHHVVYALHHHHDDKFLDMCMCMCMCVRVFVCHNDTTDASSSS